jgi:outer membrane protein assembly factor BamB
MRTAPHWVKRALLMAGLVVGPPGAVFAQPAPDAGLSASGATVPLSNEAALLSSQAQQAIQLGDYRLGLELLDRLDRLHDGLVQAPGSITCYPTWRERLRVLRMLPQEAAQLYREKYDAEARGRFERARQANDVDELRRLFQEYPISTHWPRIGAELAQRLLDRHDFAEAAAVLQTLAEHQPSADLLAQRTIALAGLEAWSAAAEARDRLSKRLAVGVDDVRIGILDAWLEKLAEPPPAPTIGAAVDAPAAWRMKFGRIDGADAGVEVDMRLAEAVERYRRLPTLMPVLDGDMLFVRTGGQIWAVDASTLTVRWSATERRRPSGNRSDTESNVDAAQILLTEPLRHSVSVAYGRVYSIEKLRPPGADEPVMSWSGGISWTIAPNVLVARDRETGEALWEVGGDVNSPLGQVAFQDVPVAAGGSIFVPFQRGQELVLAKLDPATGAVLAQTAVVGPPTYFSAAGGSSLIVTDGATLYVSTGNGVVAALSAADLSWRWAAPYDTLLAGLRGRRWWSRLPMTIPQFGFDRPVLAEDLLVVAPPDTDRILAIDRFEGRQRWPAVTRVANQVVLGATRKGIVLAGNELVCLDARDGQAVVWRSAPLELVGRPVIQGERIYVPTRQGIAVVDASNGRLVQDPAGRRFSLASKAPVGHSVYENQVVAAALQVSDFAVYAVAPDAVVKLADPDAIKASVDAGAPEEVRDAHQRLQRAWAAYLEGDAAGALEWLAGVERGGAELAAAREQLMVHTFVALAQSAEDAPSRLEWLRKAQGLSLSESAAARLGLLVGQALEDAGQLDAAREHYAGLLGGGGGVRLQDAVDQAKSVAFWVVVAERLEQLWRPLDAAGRQTLLAAALNRAHPGDPLLARWHEMLVRAGDDANAALVAARMVTGGLPTELAAPFLGEAEQLSDLPDEIRARLAVEAWAAAVADGDLLAAHGKKKAALLIAPGLEDALRSGQGSGDGLEARARAVARDMSKLEKDVALPFGMQTLMIQWKRTGQVVLQPADERFRAGNFLPVQNREQRRIELVNVMTGDTWRVTPEMFSPTRRIGQPTLEDAMRQWRPLQQIEGGATIPGFVRWQNRGAAIIPEGAIGFGLAAYGPEDRVGARWWEAPIADGVFVGEDGHVGAAGGAEGLYVLTGSLRLQRISWIDGRLVWERDMAREEVDSLKYADGRLILSTRDGNFRVVDARTGALLPEWEGILAGAGPIETARGVWVLISEENVRVVQPSTGRLLWQHPIQGFNSYAVDPNGRLLAVQESSSAAWHVLRIEDGTSIDLPALTEGADIVHLVTEGDRILTVERTAMEDDSGLRFASTPIAGGLTTWTLSLPRIYEIGLTQLVGNPNCIVVLYRLPAPTGNETAGLSLQLIDKSTGQPGERLSIQSAFGRDDGGESDPVIHVTPTRVVVSQHAVIAAWGRSSWGDEP